jgi:hypothetical protein
MFWKSTAASAAVGLLAMWWGGIASGPVAPVPAPVQAAGSSATDAAASDIERQAAKLQARLHPDDAYSAPSRNPFRFGAAPVARPRPPAPPVTAPAFVLAPFAPEAPRMSLAGIAVDVVDGATVRTAIVSTPTGVQLVKEGETVEPGYRVGRIEDDAVELVGGDGGTRRLTLSKSR